MVRRENVVQLVSKELLDNVVNLVLLDQRVML